MALLRESDWFATVGDALMALGDDPYVVWVTGQSKTADIEV